MSQQPHIEFHDGRRIPQLGLGVWRTPNDVASQVVQTALETGYRHIDTAAVYGNEDGVGAGIRASGVARGDIFLTTKVWNDDQGYDETLRAMDQSLDRLGTDYVDLYLIHWPSAHRGKYVETWKALIRLREEGKALSIGVSNFEGTYLDDLVAATGVTPVLNQIQLHPRFQQRQMREKHAALGVKTESWSPLGQGQLLSDPQLAEIAQRHGKSPAQVIIRWHLDHGFIVIPKSVTPSRIVENFDVFDFALSQADRAAIDALDDPQGRIGTDPMNAQF
jgi:2,5-diketo-D-gluconate reductase A